MASSKPKNKKNEENFYGSTVQLADKLLLYQRHRLYDEAAGGKEYWKEESNVVSNNKTTRESKVNDIDPNAKNQEYRDSFNRKKILKDTKKRNDIIETVSKKRALTPEEEEEFTDLESKYRDNELNDEELERFEELTKIRKDPNDKKVVQIQLKYKEIDKCYYINDALNIFKENTVTIDKETLVTMEPKKDKKVTIRVLYQPNFIDFAISKVNRNEKVCMVIPADKMGPGGQASLGGIGIEEDLYYRSSISNTLKHSITSQYYPLDDNHILFVPRVFVFRQSEKQNYDMMKARQAVMMPCILIPTAYGLLNERNRSVEEKKLKNAISTALFFGYNYIVYNPGNLTVPENDTVSEHNYNRMTRAITNAVLKSSENFSDRLVGFSIVFESQNKDYENLYPLHGLTTE